MKRGAIFFLVLMLWGSIGYGQESPGETLAQKIAQRMTDSLSLSADLKGKIYGINMQLHNQKMQARKESQDMNVVSSELQKIENTRDSLYRTVLPPEKFLLYKDKKTRLVNNN